ncbi:hypothetical protein BGZ96_012315 [Linnemannia gamsii]|uniref:FAD-binding domain-containing protein n=1 Tax=Linnemannia gamsii TaxID=64522 RepID=A0ABQ7KAP9_9FUNG|nr:hypothetical protein BGZ96_012315 [Linnemannia gamsii]
MTGYKESLVSLKVFNLTPSEVFTGYGQYIFARPELYDLILKQVPANKIHFGHRVLNITEENNRLAVRLSNSDIVEGDIIVGADGAYSAVRQRMYPKKKAKGTLSKSDQEDLPFSCTCQVGQTKVLDPKGFPMVAEPQCKFNSIYGDNKPFTNITRIFEEYQQERLPVVIELYNTSKQLGKIAGRNLVGAFMLFLSIYIPFWLWKLMMAR